MTPAQHDLVVAMCARAAELWAAGIDHQAERWADTAFAIVERAGTDFVDHEVDR